MSTFKRGFKNNLCLALFLLFINTDNIYFIRIVMTVRKEKNGSKNMIMNSANNFEKIPWIFI